MFCQKCGFQLGPEARFCPNCGTAVQISSTTQDAATVLMPGSDTQAPYTPPAPAGNTSPATAPMTTQAPPPVRTPMTTSPMAASANEPFLKTACYVLCILGIVCVVLSFILPLFAILGLVLSILALIGSRMKEKGTGRLLAMILSIAGITVNSLFCLAVIILSVLLVID